MRYADAVVRGLTQLAEVPTASEATFEALVAHVLTLLVDTLGAGLAFLSTIDGDVSRVVAVEDRAGMGLHAGDVVPLRDTY
jgi:hypothetical protein